MSDIAVLESTDRQIDFEKFISSLQFISAERISIKGHKIKTTIDETLDLSSYYGFYVRAGAINESVIQRARNLKIICTCGSGYDHIDLEAATRKNIIVCHTPAAPAPGAIEHTFGLIFMLLHKLKYMADQVKTGNWTKAHTSVPELYNKTLGVVGLGTIGGKVATIARQYFCDNVIAYDPYISGELTSKIYPQMNKNEVEALGIKLVNKEKLFKLADIVTLHVPLTIHTQNMVNYHELAALKGGYLINTSRGEVINEEALIDALKKDSLSGVGLDVMHSEPPNNSNYLLKSEKVIITPHIAGGTEGYLSRSAEINAKRFEKALKGQKPDGIVNPEVYEQKTD